MEAARPGEYALACTRLETGCRVRPRLTAPLTTIGQCIRPDPSGRVEPLFKDPIGASKQLLPSLFHKVPIPCSGVLSEGLKDWQMTPRFADTLFNRCVDR